MRTSLIYLLSLGILLIGTSFASAQTDEDRAAVKKAGMNYIEAFYEGDTAKLKQAVRPTFVKFGFWKDENTGKFSDPIPMSFERAVSYVEDVKAKKNFAKPGSPKKLAIIDMTGKIASARVDAWWGMDYILLSKVDGKWLIDEVIWEGPTVDPNESEDDRMAVKRAALNYVEGFYEGDSSKLKASLKPTMFKFGYGYDKKAGKFRDGGQMKYEQAIAYADRVKERKMFPKPGTVKKVEVLGVMNMVALARVEAWWGVDYMLLARNGDKWMIEQVLWAGLP